MSDTPNEGAPRGLVADPLAAPLFGPSREATPAEMALVDAEEAEEGMEEAAAAQETAEEPEDAVLTAGEQPAPAAEAPPSSPEPTPAPTDPPDNVVRLGAKPVVDATRSAMDDFPALVLSVFVERNAKTTGESYAGHLRRFLTWCAARGVDLATMPANAAQTYLEEAYPNPVSRNQAIVALRSSFDIGAIRGVTFAPQELVKTVRPPKKERTAAQAQAMPLAPPRAAMAPRGAPLAAEPPAPPRESAARSVPMESVSTPRSTPVAAPKKGTSAVPSLGGRIRISKRVDGSEGLPGVPVGALVLIGDYAGHDLDGEGRIESFIANHIRPIYGPSYGQRPVVYYVDRLDNLGNPIPGATLNVPIMPEPTPREQQNGAPPRPAGFQMPSGATATGPQAPAAASGITGDRFLDYILSEQRRREEEANKRIEELKGMATKQGMDPTMLMLLVDRVKPEPMDPAKIVAEAKRQGLLKPPREERPEPSPAPLPPPGGLGGLDAMFGGPPPPPQPDAGMEALTVVLKQQGEMIQALLTRAMTPAPPQAPQMDLAGIIALAKSLAPTPPPESALSGQVMSALITRALAPPEKPKSIAETLKEIAALNEAKELLGGGPEEKPLSFAEVVTAAIENAPAIGQAVATVLGSMPRAPTLPQPGGPARRASDPQAPGQPPPQRTAAAPMPPEAQQAFLALKVATDEQEIVNHIFTILTAYVQSGAEPWPRAANKLVDDFKKCDTKPEIRAVVTNLFVWSGAKRLMSEPAVERISTVLHAHYSMIYGQLAPGEEKTLKDADSAGEQAAAEAADAAAAAGNAPVYEEQAPGDTVGNVIVQ